MSQKSTIWWGMAIGSTLGGFVPSLWGADMLSLSGIIFSAVGGFLGIYIGYKISE
jgi:predicted MFS family arabinose efflux permease